MASYQLAGDHVAGEVVDGELIIVNLAQGTYFSSMGSGRHVWDALIAGFDMEDVLQTLGMKSENPETFDLAARKMIALLEDNDTIVPRAEPRSLDRLELIASLGDELLAPPEMETHVDMRDILMLDPIHDVGEVGWPARPGRGDSDG